MNRTLSAALLLFLAGPPVGATSTPSCQTDAPVTLQATGDIIGSGAVTKLDLSWFGLEGSSASPAFFQLTLTNSGETPQMVRVLIELEASPTAPSARDLCPSPCWLQREMTEPIEVPARSTVIRTSRDLFSTSFSAGGVEPSTSPFKSLIGRLGSIPSTYLDLRFSLLCERPGREAWNLRSTDASALAPWSIGSPVRIQSSVAMGPRGDFLPFYQAVNAPVSISPGRVAGEGQEVLRTSAPHFLFQSDLANPATVYPSGEHKFLLELWKMRPDDIAATVTDRRPDASWETDLGSVPFPGTWPALEAGATYAWRVQAQLRGPVKEPLASTLRIFQVAANPSPESPSGEGVGHLLDSQLDALESVSRTGRVLGPDERRLYAALIILTGNDSRLADLFASALPALDRLRLDGKSTSLSRVEAMAQEVLEGRRSLVHLEIP
ncbi:MAG: hypothetical protein H6686_05260 [Fibrobacteria bacterium]|nr:hypothetical protein [Fibrobacteria bacterium]